MPNPQFICLSDICKSVSLVTFIVYILFTFHNHTQTNTKRVLHPSPLNNEWAGHVGSRQNQSVSSLSESESDIKVLTSLPDPRHFSWGLFPFWVVKVCWNAFWSNQVDVLASTDLSWLSASLHNTPQVWLRRTAGGRIEAHCRGCHLLLHRCGAHHLGGGLFRSVARWTVLHLSEGQRVLLNKLHYWPIRRYSWDTMASYQQHILGCQRQHFQNKTKHGQFFHPDKCDNHAKSNTRKMSRLAKRYHKLQKGRKRPNNLSLWEVLGSRDLLKRACWYKWSPNGKL